MYGLMSFDKWILLCHHHHHCQERTFLSSQKIPLCPFSVSVSLPLPPPPWHQATTIHLLPVIIDMLFVECHISGIEPYFLFMSEFFCSACFSDSFMLLPVSIVCPLLKLSICLCVDMPPFIYLFSCWWAFGSFLMFDYYE